MSSTRLSGSDPSFNSTRYLTSWPHVVATHPGVVDSGLIAAKDRVLANIKRRAFLPVKAGAQAPLYCATQPDVVSGAYYHNLVGRVLLNPDDAAADRGKAKALWEALERLGLKGDDS